MYSNEAERADEDSYNDLKIDKQTFGLLVDIKKCSVLRVEC